MRAEEQAPHVTEHCDLTIKLRLNNKTEHCDLTIKKCYVTLKTSLEKSQSTQNQCDSNAKKIYQTKFAKCHTVFFVRLAARREFHELMKSFHFNEF